MVGPSAAAEKTRLGAPAIHIVDGERIGPARCVVGAAEVDTGGEPELLARDARAVIVRVKHVVADVTEAKPSSRSHLDNALESGASVNRQGTA